MDPALVRSIAELIKSIPGIVEAHLPQCYIAATKLGPAQILVVVLNPTIEAESALKQLHEGLGRLTLPDHHLDVMPLLPNDNLLPGVRSIGCNVECFQATEAPEIGGPVPGKWWKLW